MREFIMNEDQTPLERRADQLRAEVSQAEPGKLADFTAAQLQELDGNQFFEFLFWGNPVVLSNKDYIARDKESDRILPAIQQAMILYYFKTSRNSSPAEKWVSFSELSNAQFYNAAYQGYTSKKLLQYFQDNYQGFIDRCLETGGEKTSFGDGAYRFQILPRVAILVVYWEGDDEFPPSYSVLFEDIVDKHLPTDGCAILGSMLTGKLIQEHI
jgi:hypothetical protein